MSRNLRRVLLGTAAIVAVMVVLWLVAAGPASDRTVSNLGPDVFDKLRPANVARDAAEGPLFFRDPIEEGRDIYVAHDGGDIDRGFVAFSAINEATGCLLEFDRTMGDLYDICDGSRHQADGSTQLQYPVEVRDDRLIIDLNFQERDQAPEGADEGEP